MSYSRLRTCADSNAIPGISNFKAATPSGGAKQNHCAIPSNGFARPLKGWIFIHALTTMPAMSPVPCCGFFYNLSGLPI